MCFLSIAIVIRELQNPTIQMKYADAAFRLFLAPLVLGLIHHSKSADIKTIRWSWFFAVILMITSGGINYIATQDIRLHSHFTNTIPYAAFCAAFSLLYVSTEHSNKILSTICLILAGTLIFLSQSRGVWIGFTLALIFISIKKYDLPIKKIISVIIASTVLAYICSDIFHSRIHITLTEIINSLHGVREGSVGIRIDLARASYYIFMDSPIFGAGRDLSSALNSLYTTGHISKLAATEADTHGELVYNAASLGIVGIIYYIIFYIYTTLPFIKAMKSTNTYDIGISGVAISIIFFFTGFTHITFGLSMYASIYACIQAVLLANLLPSPTVDPIKT
ncbi:O-antigen ligase family protein [Laribacter hongkongensis]|uniref:O-antigen ligase family protein n=1 Tax=Laribacter hongkongensis TaxID=168471 RepID=UPI001EFD865C|nr:O-antigen ligase family protein [Laribacter hongkongensis]MCG9083608.1 O-antigen ligase family protein [Laribacter hongkongensis]